MATTAPAVTSAVDSQSTPMRSHTGRGLPPVLAGALVQDSSAGSARRSVAVARFDVGNLARQLIAHGLRRRAGVFADFA